jgi:bifunctional non-homologous end joining protein LigD
MIRDVLFRRRRKDGGNATAAHEVPGDESSQLALRAGLDARDLIVTGVSRSGTSYLCNLLHRFDNCVAINEPLEVIAVLRAEETPWGLEAYYRTLRADIRAGCRIENKLRRGRYRPKVAADDFVLAVKNTREFLFRLEALRQVMPAARIVACVRNPVDTIASWKGSFRHLHEADVGPFLTHPELMRLRGQVLQRNTFHLRHTFARVATSERQSGQSSPLRLTARRDRSTAEKVPVSSAGAVPEGAFTGVEAEIRLRVALQDQTPAAALRARGQKRQTSSSAYARGMAVVQTVPSELRRGERVVRLSNLDKPYWPEEGITKGDLLRYYRDVAPTLLRHLRGRPFTMKRYPDGWRGQPFFRKNVANYAPAWMKRVAVQVTSRGAPQGRTIEVPVVNDELALLWMVNTGCIECHSWYSRIDKLERPDWVVFDLDPSADVSFAETVEVALLVRQALDVFGLASFPKTSGALGLHVLVPIERRHTYDDTRRFATEVARQIAGTHPDLATTEWSKVRRRGVLIDASQNAKGKTIASVYSVRPMPGAPVSTPLRWDEVNEKLDPTTFTRDALAGRLHRHGDLYEGVLTTKQRLGPALRALTS